ncbi:DegT/DnrJ/EryC1/StrS family aminotransferase [Marinoscillum furvescens]|uniref:dTDP-4-amino-4,6-dideoxygalactose transaminase n=1 Tax=Marinoscillum furvescens DSM 4134 TaxID=1122208 RepID=A0A3D9KZG3_MARFU|nr:DegT/DnrJ/EryC1/StrS family aminotransferase [Marinoscillum furvescens]RED92298.1 dTDP-4-amino-4,6-dideoxygalactose transaminase [Marinoscillum furvescens DSM 4134]
MTPSCTAALEVCALVLKTRGLGEVIFPSFTHVSTVLPFVQHGFKPVFVDIQPESRCIDTSLVAEALSTETRGVVAVNYGGWSPDYELLRQLCDANDLLLIEDNAHGMGALRAEKPLGSFGDMAACSFERQKNISCQEGGALIVNNPKLQSAVQELTDLGTNKSAFLAGEAVHYQWVGSGAKLPFTEWQAAVLLPQLESLDAITSARKSAWNHYHRAFENHAVEGPANLEGSNGHVYYLKLKDQTERDAFIAYMAGQGIETPFHYYPQHLSTAGQAYGRFVGSDQYTSEAGTQLVRLPLFQGITTELQDEVIAAVNQFFNS